MCEYCEGKEDISNRMFEDGSKFSDYIMKVNIENIFDKKMLIVRPVEYRNGNKEQYMKYTFDINYCPMCGRKLGEQYKKKYVYFVSYFVYGNNLGMCEVGRDAKIKNYEDIKTIVEALEKNHGHKNVVILNYKLLGDD